MTDFMNEYCMHTATCGELRKGDVGREVVLCGWAWHNRDHGGLIFVDLRDRAGYTQVVVDPDCVSADDFAKAEHLGREYVLKIAGTVRERGAEAVNPNMATGEIEVLAKSVEVLNTSVTPPFSIEDGIETDETTRMKWRYLDIRRPEMYQALHLRHKVAQAMRGALNERGFLEVETPILHPILGGANARPFVTHHNALDKDFYLRIATELHLKRLLVGGFEKVFEIGRQFRNEGMDPYHNPEFTTMEFYQAFSDLEGMMELTQGVIQAAALASCGTLQVEYQGHQVDLSGSWRRATMIELASEGAGEDVSFQRTRDELVDILERNGGHAEAAWGKGKLIAEIFEAVAEEKLIQPTFVTEHPIEVSPLAKKLAGDPNLTERFELFICGHEYANAFGELNDPVDQAERFRAQVEAKDLGDDEAMGYDDDYVRALEYGMPPAGGCGIGIDRLVMLLTDAPSIRDVLLFPHMRDEAPAGGRPRAAAPAAAAPAVAEAPIDFSKVVVEPLFQDEVDFDTFSKSDFRAVKVKECVAVPKSKKLLQFTLDDGTGSDRVILSGIHAYYEPEELVGRTLIAITNLPPRKMMGVESCGMLLSAIHEEEGEERLNLLMVDDHIPAGAKLY